MVGHIASCLQDSVLPHSARAIDKLRSPTTSCKMNPMNECTRHEEPQGSGADTVEGNVVTVFTCLITATSHHCIYAHYGLHGFAMAGRHHSYLIHVCLGGNQTDPRVFINTNYGVWEGVRYIRLLHNAHPPGSSGEAQGDTLPRVPSPIHEL